MVQHLGKMFRRVLFYENMDKDGLAMRDWISATMIMMG